jgi:hypothetical protein
MPRVIAFLAAAAAAAAVAAPSAQAATSDGCAGGGYAVTLASGKTYAPGVGARLTGSQLTGGRLHVQGRYTEFDVDPRMLDVFNYTLTGTANPQDLTGGVRTPIWASKTADLGGQVLDKQVEIKPYDSTGSGVLIEGAGRSVKMKIQAKDCATGGVFQIEGERGDGRALVFTHTLAPNVFFYTNPVTGKVNIGNGAALVAKDSPMGASGKVTGAGVSTWTVQPGGRMGFVLGEDAVEASTPSSCTESCQARNQVRGTVEVADGALPGTGELD